MVGCACETHVLFFPRLGPIQLPTYPLRPDTAASLPTPYSQPAPIPNSSFPLLPPLSLQLLAFFNAKLAAQTLDAMKLSQICDILKIPSASCPNNTISQLTLIT